MFFVQCSGLFPRQRVWCLGMGRGLALETNGSIGSDLISSCIRLSLTRKFVALVSSSMSSVVAPGPRQNDSAQVGSGQTELTGLNCLLNISGHGCAPRSISRRKAIRVCPNRPGEVGNERRDICLDNTSTIFRADLECMRIGNYKLSPVTGDYVVYPEFLVQG
jgi:hypothetical protein